MHDAGEAIAACLGEAKFRIAHAGRGNVGVWWWPIAGNVSAVHDTAIGPGWLLAGDESGGCRDASQSGGPSAAPGTALYKIAVGVSDVKAGKPTRIELPLQVTGRPSSGLSR